MNTKKFILSVLLAFTGIAVKAQFPNAAMFNTAVDVTGAGTLPLLSQDLHWTAALTSSTAPYSPCVVVFAPGWDNSPASNADWISFPHTCSVNPSDHSCDGVALDIYYKLIVNLPACKSYTSPTAYCVDLKLMADNCVSEVFLNGVSNYQAQVVNPAWYPGFSVPNQVSVTLCNNWQPGTNTILVHVISGAYTSGGQEGFLATATQTIHPNQVNTPVLNVTGNFTICQGNTASLTASGATTYSWNNMAGATMTASPAATTSYSLTGTLNGCSTTKIAAVTVSKCTGISEINDPDDLKIYPNPTNGLVKFMTNEKPSSIEVYNFQGDSVFKVSSEKAEMKEIDFTNWVNGIYFVKISSEKGSIIKKVVKQ